MIVTISDKDCTNIASSHIIPVHNTLNSNLSLNEIRIIEHVHVANYLRVRDRVLGVICSGKPLSGLIKLGPGPDPPFPHSASIQCPTFRSSFFGGGGTA